MRRTIAKNVVENIFKSTTVPINLNDLFLEAKKSLQQVAYSTIYRIVQKLEQEQKITKIDWRDRGSYYEWSKHKHHHHIVCQECDSITDIDDDTLTFSEQVVSKKTGFLVKQHSIELYGLCKDCQKGSAA